MKRKILSLLAFLGRHLRHTPLARSVLLNRLLGSASVRLHPETVVKIGPFQVQFDPRDRFITKKLALYGEYDRAEIDLLCSLVEAGDQVLDVGANIGIYTLFLAQAVGPNGRVVAIEPDPDNFRLLSANVKRNGFENIHTLDLALGDRSGQAFLYQVSDNRGGLSLALQKGASGAIEVPIRRGEEVLRELRMRPQLVKIDVEGSEARVFEGLGYRPNFLFFEFIPALLEQMQSDPLHFLQQLEKWGYSMEKVEPETGSLIQLAADRLLEEVRNPSRWTGNILARLDR